MKIKTKELTGAALDWAVAKCEALPLVLDPMGFRKDAPDSPQSGWWVWLAQPGSMIVGYAPKSNKDGRGYSPATDWAQGGPIIEREHLEFDFREDTQDYACFDGYRAATGPTHLIAAMRCYVASKLGDEVDVPEELL